MEWSAYHASRTHEHICLYINIEYKLCVWCIKDGGVCGIVVTEDVDRS